MHPLARLVVAALAALPSTLLSQQFALARKQHIPLDSVPSNAVAVGDVDADGDLDVFLEDGTAGRTASG
ncbi:MAG: hypothetical protein ACE5F1_12820 [Planctomycetota bacterium]